MPNKKLMCPFCGHIGLQKAGTIIIDVAGDHVKTQWKCPVCRRRTLNPLEVK